MPHPNDMTRWAEIECQRGCTEHRQRDVQIHLGGPTMYHDYPPIPLDMSLDIELAVWDTGITPVDGGPYCPARDAVSETLISHGVWEPRETIILMDAFRRLGDDGCFVDIGSQVGYFSAIAAKMGMVVLAVEADPAVAVLCDENIQRNGVRDDQSFTLNRRVGPDANVLDGFTESPRLVVKIDVEGAEPDAIRMLQPVLDREQVDFMVIECSPVFHDGYPALVQQLMDYNMIPHTLPEKRQPPRRLTGIADLMPDYQMWSADQIADYPQTDLVFVRKGAV